VVPREVATRPGRIRCAAPLLLAFAIIGGAAGATSLEEAEQAVRERRFADAAAIWEELAREGLPEAQYRLGSLYRSGRGVPVDHAKAAEWFLAAAKVGHPKAQYGLGTLYQNGWGVEADRAKAVRWYRKAAERGHAMARTKLQEIRRASAIESVAPARLGLGENDPTADLHRAVELGDRAAVRAALARGAKVDARTPSGRTALTDAIDRGRIGLLAELFAAGADPNAADSFEDTPLMLAAREGLAGIVSRLLEAGAVPDAPDSAGSTALMIAARKGHAGVIRVLVAAKADLDLRNADGRTAYELAAASGQATAARELRIAGATMGRPRRNEAAERIAWLREGPLPLPSWPRSPRPGSRAATPTGRR
jgi:TPR repeat protein